MKKLLILTTPLIIAFASVFPSCETKPAKEEVIKNEAPAETASKLELIDKKTADLYKDNYSKNPEFINIDVLKGVNITTEGMAVIQEILRTSKSLGGIRISYGKKEGEKETGLVIQLEEKTHYWVAGMIRPVPVNPCPPICDDVAGD